MTITASAAAGTYWQGLRLVVLDTETTETLDGTPRRCVSVGAVTCRHGTVRSRWQRLVDPGIPIDPVSHSIHHISNDHLAGEASFDAIADELLALLEPRDGETVIVAAHNVGFDVSVLRYELQQTDRDLPDVAVLDTMGPLVALAGIELHRPSLNDLLAELGLVNRAAHDALADAEACAAVLRCGHLTGRVERAEPEPARLVGPLTDVLDGRLADSDTAGAASVLAALVPLLDHLPPRKGRLGKRDALLQWADERASLLATLGRCLEDDGCPACRAREPCALDLWSDTVAQLALGDPDRYARGFFEMTGKEAATGAYTSWLARGVDQRICDAALWRCVEHWRTVEMFKRAEQVIELGWSAGCRHPDLTDAYSGQLAASGRLANYDRAIDVCDEALAIAGGSTHPGWARLRSRRNQLAGRRQRILVRPSG